MPKRSSGVVIHDDSFHTGSAKRDTNSGVAGLDSSGNVLGKGSTILLTRDGTNTIFLNDRTSGENAMKLLRNGINDYAAYVREGGAVKRIQSEGMKDVASGIVAQDAGGNAIITGPNVEMTRDGSNSIYVTERTSNESVLWMVRKLAGLYHLKIDVSGTYQTIAPLDVNGDIPHMRPKSASANLRHSHDAEILNPSMAYSKAKTMTFANGITGTLRIAFDINPYAAVANTIFGKVRKTVSGVTSDLGAEQSVVNGIIYVTKTQDINVGVLAPGDTLEIWTYNSAEPNGGVQNFRVSYDNAADTVLVAGVSNS